MYARKSLTLPNFVLYSLLFIASFSLFFIGKNGEPFALSLLFAALFSGLSPSACCLIYGASALADFSLAFLPVYAGQAGVLFLGFWLQKRSNGKSLFALLSLTAALFLFVAFAPFSVYAFPPSFGFLADETVQKIAVSAFVFLLSAVFTVAVKAITRKLLRCRLKTEELLFCAALYVCCGVGICRAASVIAYMGIALFILLLFSCMTKDASAIVCAFVVSLPCWITSGLSPERFFVYGLVVTLLSSSGRFVAVTGLLLAFFAYGYFDGIFAYSSAALTATILSALVPSLLFIMLPTSLVRKLENKLIFYREKHLSRVAINRNRAAIGEKLFEISGVFREIQATFTSLGSNEAENGAKEYIRGAVTERVCKRCGNYRSCTHRGREQAIEKLVEIGTAKGKASLVDIPRELAEICTDQSGILYAINGQLGDYRRYMLEAENAKDGRNLLANQAQGISEILKNIALEQSQPLDVRSDKERGLDLALLKVGIVCSEILVTGEADNPTLSLVTFGKADIKKIAAVASCVLAVPMIISERLTLGKDKFCCILRKKPRFDAAFGVAALPKTGETVSGDTHSVIRIDERRFMLALSDGMGSGEYAQKISESTISLLESFYRAKMPSSLVLSTINKLLTFSKEETFACVDIAIVDLDSGVADIVKIGSPIGFILTENTLKVLDSASLPLGILESLHPDTSTYALQENDVLLFLSDGITSAFSSSADLYEALKQVPAANPQQLADTVLSHAVELYGGVAKDDMTVLAVRLFKSMP